MITRLTILLFLSAALRAADPMPPPGMTYVHAGEFLMGCNEGNYDEAPAHQVRLPAYFIDVNEVTIAEFNEFVRLTDNFDVIEGPWFRVSTAACVELLARYEKRYGTTFVRFQPPALADKAAAERLTLDALHWKAAVAALRVLLSRDRALADGPAADLVASPIVRALIAAEARLPVAFVTWRDATAYARWAGKRLPTEAEWEMAARGPDGRIYPWGAEWDPARARAGLDVDAGPTAVGSYPSGASPYGCRDMAGNVWEWCEDWYGEYYYKECPDGMVDPKGPPGLPNGELPRQDPTANFLRNAAKQGRETDTRKVVRGGCWAGGTGLIGQTEFNNRGSRRMWSNPDYWSQDTGFRCAKDAP
jgi:formylglycine-generating enzyme required for sulfatase activity